MSVDTEHSLGEINELLCVDAVLTERGGEVKLWRPDGEGGVDKTYLDAAECQRLADAFGLLALALAAKKGGGA